MKNIEQARELYSKFRRPTEVPHRGEIPSDGGFFYVQPYLLGLLNRPSFTENDILWGPKSAGSLYLEWDCTNDKPLKLWASFSMPPWGDIYCEDYSELISEELHA